MKSQNTKSSDELQKDVRHELRNVRKDLDVMSSRLSPGQLIDDVIFYPHGRSPGATFDHLKRNPVGTAFLSLGTILLMEDDSHQTMETLSKNKLGVVRDKVQEVKQKMNMHPTQSELAMDKVNEFRDKVDELKSEMEYKVASARDKIDSVKDTVEQKFERSQLPDIPVEEEFSAAKSNVKEKLSNFVSSGREKIQNIDNVTFMALGAGLGVLTGASLPVSESESSFVESKLGDKLSGFSGDLQSAINECSNILKDLVISDVKDMKVELFK